MADLLLFLSRPYIAEGRPVVVRSKRQERNSVTFVEMRKKMNKNDLKMKNYIENNWQVCDHASVI